MAVTPKLKQQKKPKGLKPQRKKKQTSDDNDIALINQAVAFYLQNIRLKSAEAYAVRGRRFRAYSAPELREVFAVAYRQMALTMSPESRRDYDDCESEYILRGEALPEGEDMAESKALMIKRAEGYARRLEGDKRLMHQLGRGLLEDVLADLEEDDSKGEH
jgi:hypothetical protein